MSASARGKMQKRLQTERFLEASRKSHSCNSLIADDALVLGSLGPTDQCTPSTPRMPGPCRSHLNQDLSHSWYKDGDQPECRWAMLGGIV